jgi:hypothetical protein
VPAVLAKADGVPKESGNRNGRRSMMLRELDPVISR